MPQEPADEQKPSSKDWAHTVTKAGLSLIPVVGGAAAEFFGTLVAPPLVRRRDEWVRSIAERLHQIEAKVDGFQTDSLVSNEAFLTAFLHASQAAVRSHQQEKLEALRNAVLNVALGRAPDEDLQLIFLNLVDELTPWHLRVLSLFKRPPGSFQKDFDTLAAWQTDLAAGNPPEAVQFLQYAFPELRDRAAFSMQISRDLESRGLLYLGKIAFSSDERRAAEKARRKIFIPEGVGGVKRTTTLGDLFLDFITSPVA